MEGERLDRRRLVLSACELGLTGYMLENLLDEKYAVNMELADDKNVLAIVTYANEREDMDRMVAACAELRRASQHGAMDMALQKNQEYPPVSKPPQQILTPRKAYFSNTKKVRWQEAAGQVSGQVLAPYPPGIPAIYPGEQISQEVWEYIECFRRDGRHIHGAGKDGRLDFVKVVESSFSDI